MPTNHTGEDPWLDTIEMQRAAARRRLGQEDHAGRAGRAAKVGGVADGRGGRGPGEGGHVGGGE